MKSDDDDSRPIMARDAREVAAQQQQHSVAKRMEALLPACYRAVRAAMKRGELVTTINFTADAFLGCQSAVESELAAHGFMVFVEHEGSRIDVTVRWEREYKR